MLVLYSLFFRQMLFFSVFMLWHTYAHCHPKRSLKWTLSHQKTSHNLLNTCTFKLNFQDKVQWCANCFFHILSFSFKCFFFSVLNSWHTYAHSNRNRSSNGRTSLRKKGHVLLKILFLRLYFWDEGDLYANSLFDVLTICPKCCL